VFSWRPRRGLAVVHYRHYDSLGFESQFLAKAQRRTAKGAKKNSSAMTENEIARVIVDAAYQIHTRLGPGLFESVYECALAYELEKRGLRFERQKAIPVIYETLHMEEGFRADLIVEGKVIVEPKSIEAIAPVHKKQLLTYLRLSDKRLGLLINFNVDLIKDGITRIVNGLRE
jgi:GxxExxY protein